MGLENLLWVNLLAVFPLAILGSLLHFAYDWSRHNRLVAVFCAVNESYWEHIKIAFWPVLLWLIIQFAAGGWNIPGFIPAAAIALYAVPVSMITLVFGYKRLLGRNVLWIDIAAFAVSVAISLSVFALVAVELDAGGWTIGFGIGFVLVIVGAFTRYTLHPPAESDFFIDPLNSRYGIAAHPDAPAQPGGRRATGAG